MLVAEDDATIECLPHLYATEFVSRDTILFNPQFVARLQLPKYKQLMLDMKQLFTRSFPCEMDHCGLHIHMSLPGCHVNDHPFLFIVLQEQWIETYQKKSIDQFKTRTNSYFSRLNEKVLSKLELKKKLSLNLVPTFKNKVDLHYVEKDDDELVYHVEFRGQKDALQIYGKKD